jgi:hypothetical protein
MKPVWVGCLVLICLSGSSAWGASDISAKLRTCAGEQNDAQRLECYDKLATESAKHVEAAPNAPTTADAEQKFAEPPKSRQAGQPPEITQITSVVVKVSARPNDRWAVTLENMQVWEQNESDTRVVLHAGDVVTIKKGTMGSHLLTGPSKGATYVRRVR